MNALYLSTGGSPCTADDGAAAFFHFARAATPAEAEERASMIAAELKEASVVVHTDCANTINALPIERGSFVLCIDGKPWSTEQEAAFWTYRRHPVWDPNADTPAADTIRSLGWWSKAAWRSVVGQEEGWDPFTHDTIPHAQAWLFGRRQRRRGGDIGSMPAALADDQDLRIEWSRGWIHEGHRLAATDPKFPDAPGGPYDGPLATAEATLEAIAEQLGVDVTHVLDGRTLFEAIEENKGARADRITIRVFKGADTTSYALDWLARGCKAALEDLDVTRREDNSLDVRLPASDAVQRAAEEATRSAAEAEAELAELRRGIRRLAERFTDLASTDWPDVLAAVDRRLDEVYQERNLVALALASCGRALGWGTGIYRDPESPWPVLSIITPWGEVSWHLPPGTQTFGQPLVERWWDGHTKAQAIERLKELAAASFLGGSK